MKRNQNKFLEMKNTIKVLSLLGWAVLINLLSSETPYLNQFIKLGHVYKTTNWRLWWATSVSWTWGAMMLENRKAHEIISIFIVFFLEGISQFSMPDRSHTESSSFTGLRLQRSWELRPNLRGQRTVENWIFSFWYPLINSPSRTVA